MVCKSKLNFNLIKNILKEASSTQWFRKIENKKVGKGYQANISNKKAAFMIVVSDKTDLGEKL